MSIGAKMREVLGTDNFTETGEKTEQQITDLAIEQAKRLQEYGNKIYAPVTYKQYTAEEIFAVLEKNSRLKIDEFNRRIIKLMCLYFTNDQRFEDQGGDLKKGLLLSGGTGVGKTTLMDCFRRNINHCYGIKPCAVVADEYSRTPKSVPEGTPTGREIVSMYARNREITPSSMNFGQSKSGYCFDDLGQEPETKHYGDSERIMAPIIEARYRLGHFNSTHITTNLIADQIGQGYGERVRSRMAEMFNVLNFPEDAPDRRRNG